MMTILVQRRYSEFRALHKRLKSYERMLNKEKIPELPTWFRMQALYTSMLIWYKNILIVDKMQEKDIEDRRFKLEKYLR